MAIDHPAAPRLKEQFPQVAFKGSDFHGQVQIVVPRDQFAPVMRFLRDDSALGYDMLSDVSCVDYLNYSGWDKARFGLVYILNSVAKETRRLVVRVFLDEKDLSIASMVSLYAGAEWLEREVFDMFGVHFTDHPDLRRILTWDSFGAHPLRKDYPVTGRGERENFPVVGRESA